MAPRGRPRDTRLNERVLRSAAELIFERGYAVNHVPTSTPRRCSTRSPEPSITG
ncbi:hypothetical protein ACFQ08_09045 [Streptosporangium algeriense]|uniref:HTH tetR-type domain-containing protein n=1 Tax=Streptosporangium algeriense TaxID=1682748 RepID=A0ABW3DNW7_9ACTN